MKISHPSEGGMDDIRLKALKIVGWFYHPAIAVPEAIRFVEDILRDSPPSREA